MWCLADFVLLGSILRSFVISLTPPNPIGLSHANVERMIKIVHIKNYWLYNPCPQKNPHKNPQKSLCSLAPWFIPFCLVNWVALFPPCPCCPPGCSLIGGIWSSRWGRRRMILGAFTAVLNRWPEGRYPFSSAVIALSARLKLLN